MLSLIDVHTYYGHIHALKGVSLEVQQNEIVAILGANGAGKSTLLKTVGGFQPSQKGRILLDGKEIGHLRPEKVVEQGIGLVFERREIFTNMTVCENLEMGAYSRLRLGQCDRKKLALEIEEVYELFPNLREKSHVLSSSLSGGQQQMLALGRALMSKPRLLLLDEPSMGLAPLLVKEIFRVIKELTHRGATLLLVEQNSKASLIISDRAYILQTGTVALTDKATNLLDNPEVARLYLGDQAGVKLQ